MAVQKGQRKEKRDRKRAERLRRLEGVDLCACTGGHQQKCEGVCRKVHTNPTSGEVHCGELYHIDIKEEKQGGPKKPKRGWKFGKQKESNEHKDAKQNRREKIVRDQT